MTQDELKKKVAEAVLQYIKGVTVLGVGTGSTVNHLINLLAENRGDVEAAVSSSEATTARLKQVGIPVIDLNEAGTLDVYVDGADEVNSHFQMIKGGGGALTREKIVGAASRKFICIADATKYVDVLGKYPLPIETIPMARSYVAREMVKLGGQPVWRQDLVSDNGGHIIDVHNLDIPNPVEMEKLINDIPGVITNGLFALRPADLVLLGAESGIQVLQK